MTCPECGSDMAVSKAEAWDALASIPPKTQDELARLRAIEAAARGMLGIPPGKRHEVVTVPVSLDAMNALRAAFGLVAL